MDQLFVFPRETAEQQGGFTALPFGEVLFRRPFEVMDLPLGNSSFAFKPCALFKEALLDYVLYR